MVSTARARSDRSRCPGCGEPLRQPSPSQCPLCAYVFEDARATSEDVTPYARAYAAEEPGWRSMLAWVWMAGSARLKHLALMRSSAASRRFARLNGFLLVAGLGALAWTRFGWVTLAERSGREAGIAVAPDGPGWLHAAAAPVPLPEGWPAETATDLWWNAAHAITAILAAWVSAGVLLCLWSVLVRFGVRISHAVEYRGEQRMSAALDYGTAWVVPLVLAAIAYLVTPLSYVGAVRRSAWIPHGDVFLAVSAGLAGVVLALWWFWLIRLAFSTPPNMRGRVVAFFAIGVPTLTAVLVGGWWLLLPRVLPSVYRALGLGA